jgi:hypothetical protein
MRVFKDSIEVGLMFRGVVWNECGCLAKMVGFVKWFNGMRL